MLEMDLKAKGFETRIYNDKLLQCLLFLCPPHATIRVQVRGNDFKNVTCFLDREPATSVLLQRAIRCPSCGSLRVQYPQFAHKAVIPNIIVGVMATFGAEKDFYCEDCHYTWPKEGSKISPSRPNGAPYYFIEGVPQRQAPVPETRKAA